MAELLVTVPSASFLPSESFQFCFQEPKTRAGSPAVGETGGRYGGTRARVACRETSPRAHATAGMKCAHFSKVSGHSSSTPSHRRNSTERRKSKLLQARSRTRQSSGDSSRVPSPELLGLVLPLRQAPRGTLLVPFTRVSRSVMSRCDCVLTCLSRLGDR